MKPAARKNCTFSRSIMCMRRMRTTRSFGLIWSGLRSGLSGVLRAGLPASGSRRAPASCPALSARPWTWSSGSSAPMRWRRRRKRIVETDHGCSPRSGFPSGQPVISTIASAHKHISATGDGAGGRNRTSVPGYGSSLLDYLAMPACAGGYSGKLSGAEPGCAGHLRVSAKLISATTPRNKPTTIRTTALSMASPAFAAAKYHWAISELPQIPMYSPNANCNPEKNRMSYATTAASREINIDFPLIGSRENCRAWPTGSQASPAPNCEKIRL